MKDSDKNTVLAACLAKSANLAGLIEYATDSIVSKTIIDKSIGTVTLFAFDSAQGLSEHRAPFDALVQVIDGQGIFIIDGKEITAKAGDVLIMPADIPHAVQAKERFKMLLTMIRA